MFIDGIFENIAQSVFFITMLLCSILIILWATALLSRKIRVLMDELSKLRNDISIINNEIEVLTSHLRQQNAANKKPEHNVQA